MARVISFSRKSFLRIPFPGGVHIIISNHTAEPIFVRIIVQKMNGEKVVADSYVAEKELRARKGRERPPWFTRFLDWERFKDKEARILTEVFNADKSELLEQVFYSVDLSIEAPKMRVKRKKTLRP